MDEGKHRPAFAKDGEYPSGGVAVAAPPGLYEEEVAREGKEKGAGWLSVLGSMALLREDAQNKVRVAVLVRLGRAVRAQPAWSRDVRGSFLLPLPPAALEQ